MLHQAAIKHLTNKISVKTDERQLTLSRMIVLHLLPGALVMLMMLIASSLLNYFGVSPSVPVLFAFVAPLLILIQLGFLYYKGWQRNGTLSLQGIMLYRDQPLPWWKLMIVALPPLVWLAFVWFVVKPPVNGFFIKHLFAWMPANFLDEYFLQNMNQYSPALLRVIAILFPISITLGGMVEELYFRGYLLPRMEHLGIWAPITNTVLFSLYHFWSPWENVARLLALTPWIFSVWRTRNIYLALLIHFVVNSFAGISMLSLILRSI